jgi:hypothetical protein
MIILGAELPDEGLLLHSETSAKLLKLLTRAHFSNFFQMRLEIVEQSS